MFSQSEHPHIPLSCLPRPREWIFIKDEDIIVFPFYKYGNISSIETSYAEVGISEEGLHHIPWHRIRKSFQVGDFVHITSGPDHNTSGWVISINKDIATIASKITEDEIKKISTDAKNVSYCNSFFFFSNYFFQSVDVHINLLVATPVPFQHSAKAQSTSHHFSLVKQCKHHWCGTDVIIAKQGSMWKEKTGKIQYFTLPHQFQVDSLGVLGIPRDSQGVHVE